MTSVANTSPSIEQALLASGLLDEVSVRRASQVATTSGQSIVAVVHQLALADDQKVVEILGDQTGLASVRDEDLPSTPIAIEGMNSAFLRRRRLLPLGWQGDHLLVGIIDPNCTDDLAALSFAAGCAAEPRLMSVSAQKRAFDTLYGASADADKPAQESEAASLWVDDAQRMRDQSGAGPAVRIVDAILEHALDASASDIHIEPLSDRTRVRLRIDGALQTVREEPAHLAAPIAARIKVLANMDIANRRIAQDGRTSLAARGRPVDVRISSVPSAYGETIALRLLRREKHLLDLPTLGFSGSLLSIMGEVLERRRGLFLVTGPTGSGKTTTLYAMIEQLRGAALKILSIEDPIEYYFPDVTQVQVNEDAGITFPQALRSFLRQDPDVILVGEIRDSETARIAVQAALTGHLVLATLHTTDAPSAITRLVDLGVDRYLVAATLIGVTSQRLIRQLCPHCRALRPPNAHENDRLHALLNRNGPFEIGEAKGCGHCNGRGALGRLAAAEGFVVDDVAREAMSDTSSRPLLEAITARGFEPITVAIANEAAVGRVPLVEIDAAGFA
ncbi:twitching motility protein PilT [alpha proteobacterium U9-1i]|nr:twitching motility protein PilT [alpha proteobacterium U9-1i]